MNRSDLSQNQKYLGFKKAFNTYKHHLENENYIAAYVIAFSILEDRVSAMYVIRLRQTQKKPDVWHSFVKKLGILKANGDIDDSNYAEWKKAAMNRNSKIHAAMWRVDEFSKTDCEDVIKFARQADTARIKQKKELGQ